jgi:hypothetical protein
VESPLANVCDTNYTSIAKMPKRYLANSALGGVHAHLRELAAALLRLPGAAHRRGTDLGRNLAIPRAIMAVWQIRVPGSPLPPVIS